LTNYHKSVPGAQLTNGERKFIFDCAREVESELGEDVTMINIGIQWGASLWCIREGAPNAYLIGVDIDLRHDRKAQHERIQFESEFYNTDLIEAESASYGRVFRPEVALLLIDGDHHYNQVYADIRGWVPNVCQGGIVIFHDYEPTELNLRQFPELEGVKRAVDEYFGDGWERDKGPDSIIAFRRVR